MWPVALAAVVAVVVGGAGAAALLLPQDDWTPTPFAGTSESSSTSEPSSTVTVSEREPSTQTHTEVVRQPRESTSTTTVYEDAREGHTEEIDTSECSDDYAYDTLEQRRSDTWSSAYLDDRWVLQLDSKYSGVVDPRETAPNGSHTFYNSDICEVQGDKAAMWSATGYIHHTRASDSGRSQTGRSSSTWVLLLDPYDAGYGGYSKDEAEAACADLFPSLSGDDLANECVPRKLSDPGEG